MSIIALRPAHELEYVQKARLVFKDKLPGQDFDAEVWDLKPLRKRAHGTQNPNLYWTLYGSLTEPLPPGFIEPIKAACVLDLQSATNLQFRCSAARFLWEHLKKKHKQNEFQWAKMRTDDMLGMEREMLRAVANTTTYKTCVAWNRMIELLTTALILRPMSVPWVTPRTSDTSNHTIRGQEERAEKLPSRRAMEAVADLFAGLAKEPPDRLLACAAAIAATTGVRVGELLTVPDDCLVEANGALFLKIWIEKNKEREVDLRKVPVRAEDLVRAAVAEAQEITAGARARALVLEQNPGQAPLPDHAPLDRLTPREAMSVVGMKAGQSISAIYQAIARRTDPATEKPYYLAGDVSDYLVGRQGGLWSVDLGAGRKQSLSESLFVVPVNFFHRQKGVIPLLVGPVKDYQLNQFLGSGWARCEESREGAVLRDGEWFYPSNKSIFERLGMRDDDGSIIEITSHQFRHWITTQTKIGGAPNAIVARWQNRSHKGDLSAYHHLTIEQRVETLRGAIEAGTVTGDIADVYFSLAEDVRDAFLEDQLQHVHVTALGLCIHDFSASPCPHHLVCLKGDCGPCRDFLHDRDDPVQVEQLVQLELRTQTVLEEEEKQAATVGEQISESWIGEHRQVLANIQRVKSTPGDGIIRPFADQESKFTLIREG